LVLIQFWMWIYNQFFDFFNTGILAFHIWYIVTHQGVTLQQH